jgi:(S)-sulfolactate dehydrogenase
MSKGSSERKPVVLVTEQLTDEAFDWLAERCEAIRAKPGDPAFEAAAAKAEALVVRTYTLVTDVLLSTLPALTVVGRGGVGLDNIDLDACARRDIKVVSTPDANTQAVVEYVTCLLCDALRPRATLDRPLPKAEWDELRDGDLVAPWQMNELTLGILGLGRIGRRVADVAKAIGFEVIFNDLRGIPDEERGEAEPVDVETLFRNADVLTIHVDGRPSNRHYVGERLLSRMKPDAILLNTSRGMVIDHDALATWLRESPMRMALLDVHDPEPITDRNPLLGLDNAHLFPHLASRTRTATGNMSWVVRDVVAALGL